MDTRSVPAPPATRTTRGIALYRERAEEIVRIYPHTWSVPSCSDSTSYTVHLAPRERCDCPDFERHHKPCKHVFAANVAAVKSKTRRRRRSA